MNRWMNESMNELINKYEFNYRFKSVETIEVYKWELK